MLDGSTLGEMNGRRAHGARARGAVGGRVAAAAAALICAGQPAAALAIGNRVSVRVSKNVVTIGRTFKLTASGEASSHDVLWQFLDYKPCADTERAEAARRNVSEHASVFGIFRIGPLTANSGKAGDDHACAYLVHHGRTVARSAARFTVVR